MTFTTLMAILGVVGSAIYTESFPTLFLIPFLFKVMIENDNLKDRVWLLENRFKKGDK